MRMRSRRAIGAALVGMGLACAPAARAALVLTSVGTPVGENFDSFQGTAASLSPNFTVGGTTPPGFGGVFTDGSSGYSTTNGIYAGTQSTNTADNAFTSRVPVSTSLFLTFTLTNNTGQAISGVHVTWNQEQYQDAAATPNNINLLVDNGTNGASFDQTKLTGAINNNELQSTGTTTVYPTPLTAARAADYTQSIPAGGSVQFQYQWIPGGGGNRPIHGIDDLVLTAVVPEPGSAALVGLGLVGFLGRRRR